MAATGLPLTPGESAAPLLMVTAPETDPLPASTLPALLTVTAPVPVASKPLTVSRPPLTVVPPL